MSLSAAVPETMLSRPTEVVTQEGRRGCVPFLLLAGVLHLVVLAVPVAMTQHAAAPAAEPPLLASLRERSPVAARPRPTETRPARTDTSAKAASAAPRVLAAHPDLPLPAQPAAEAAGDKAGAPGVTDKVSGTPAASVGPSEPRFNADYLNNPRPRYPAISKRLNESGKVLLRVRVSAEGLPVAVNLVQSSNFPRLDEAARQAVSQWRFVPARLGNVAVDAEVVVPIVFRLDE